MLETLDMSDYTPSAKKLVVQVRGFDIIPPKNGEKYETRKHIFVTGENSSVMLTELTVNLVKLLADKPDMPYWEAFIKAGYNVNAYFRDGRTVPRIKANLTSNCNKKMVPGAITFLAYLKHGAAEELLIDAQWVLAESVGLYEECRREKQYTQAARLLENIATHTSVDAKVSQRIQVEGVIDYAALLQQADDRLTIPSVLDTDIIDVEVEVVEEHVPARQ